LIVSVFPATCYSVEDVLPRIRESDRIEGEAQSGLPFAVAVRRSVESSSIAMAFCIGGRVEALAGVAPGGGSVGVPWMVATPLPFTGPRWRRAVARYGLRCTAMFQRRYPVLANYVHAEHDEAIRFLRWLGYRILYDQPLENRGLTFYPFYRGSPPCASR